MLSKLNFLVSQKPTVSLFGPSRRLALPPFAVFLMGNWLVDDGGFPSPVVCSELLPLSAQHFWLPLHKIEIAAPLSSRSFFLTRSESRWTYFPSRLSYFF